MLIRITDDTPEKLWQLAVETSPAVDGLPLYITTVFTDSYEKIGLEMTDAQKALRHIQILPRPFCNHTELFRLYRVIFLPLRIHFHDYGRMRG